MEKSLREKGWTPAKFARIIGCQPNNVYAWLAGRSLPSLRNAFLIEHVFGIPACEWARPTLDDYTVLCDQQIKMLEGIEAP